VYVDMVGDVFHWGHVECLRKARAFGDYLIVGLLSDDQAEAYKRRPRMSLEERVRIVEACPYVDEVLPDCPLVADDEWIDRHSIDIVVHGDDYDAATIMKWYGDAVARGIFRTIDYTPGISSSLLTTAPRPGTTRRSLLFRAWRKARRTAVVGRIRCRLQPTLFARDLRRLHDVLAATELANRYFVFGGLLVGWAREGRVLPNDVHDADFAFPIDYTPAFITAAQALTRAGFTLTEEFRNNHGEIAEYRFARHSANFEFFVLWRNNGTVRHYQYADATEMVCEFPEQELVPFEFLGRTWLKPADHDAFLTRAYGDWHTPDPNWDYTNDGTIVERHPRRFL
jgi:cytidyltransferase-like protein